jgi:hypothetical protein
MVFAIRHTAGGAHKSLHVMDIAVVDVVRFFQIVRHLTQPELRAVLLISLLCVFWVSGVFALLRRDGLLLAQAAQPIGALDSSGSYQGRSMPRERIEIRQATNVLRCITSAKYRRQMAMLGYSP